MYKYKGNMFSGGSYQTSDLDIHTRMQRISQEMQESREELINRLDREGVAMAMPNDGWVDREEQSFVVVYPYLTSISNLKKGDVVYLGDEDGGIKVRVTRYRTNFLGQKTYWYEIIEEEKEEVTEVSLWERFKRFLKQLQVPS